ncbi:hypothetical protein INR77_02965 [Erythrobacter sp. SCSIO 43205]|uniref:hypothetical protein n=1 Tax=Erythrobacter sp. SCSIO 43205 TaxID=2779361 RepID=UPI001CA972A4|nr:hypothetical protein [Erythrobacter sp. SCSIO 43205]UAB78704.1 hypothetical protein INR77_02965 [Erythrobacter sp. SCSIO 43205]
MPSKEVNRLAKLKVETLPTTRLRNELSKARENFAKEIQLKDAATQQQKKQITNLTQALNAENKKLKELQSENAKLKGEVKTLGDRLQSMTKPGAQTEAAFEIKLEPMVKTRLEALEAEKVSLIAQLSAANQLVEKLQADKAQENDAVKTLSTDEIIQKFSEEITAANRMDDSDFEIDDVEVDVRGALGQESGKMVMGFDAKRQASPEAATRIKFSLKRRVQSRIIEEE